MYELDGVVGHPVHVDRNNRRGKYHLARLRRQNRNGHTGDRCYGYLTGSSCNFVVKCPPSQTNWLCLLMDRGGQLEVGKGQPGQLPQTLLRIVNAALIGDDSDEDPLRSFVPNPRTAARVHARCFGLSRPGRRSRRDTKSASVPSGRLNGGLQRAEVEHPTGRRCCPSPTLPCFSPAISAPSGSAGVGP